MGFIDEILPATTIAKPDANPPTTEATAEKSTEAQASTKEAFVKPSEAQEWTVTDDSGVAD